MSRNHKKHLGILYLHIPYCHRRCTYCAFYSSVTAGDKQGYVEALCQELHLRRGEQNHPLRTIYFGGGTPTILTIEQLFQVVETIRQNYDTCQLEEVTIEANPEDLTVAYTKKLRELDFFNRVSIGVQSFKDKDLRMLNRRHNALQSLEAVRNVEAAGFSNISIDLIYGLPGQTLEDWQDNLYQLESLPVSHFSAYSLTVEEGTMLEHQIAQGKVIPADEETVLSQYGTLLEWAAREDFIQYEISNFCRAGKQSRHNSRYWDRTPYIGVGAAAHSFDGRNRRWNVADVGRYVETVAEGNPQHEEETLTLADAYNEYVMTALRTTAGIEKAKVERPFYAQLTKKMKRFEDEGLIEETPTHYKPTRRGLLQADGMAVELMVEG